MPEYRPRFDSLNVRPTDVYFEMGYTGNALPDEYTSELTRRLLADVGQIVCPKFDYLLVDGHIESMAAITDGGPQFRIGPTLSRLLDGSSRFALFVATAGEEYEAYRAEAAGDALEEFVIDAIGTAIVEKAGDYMEKIIRSAILPLGHTNRISPGYCGWEVGEQQKLFACLGKRNCGVTLSASCMMRPVKSISGMIGIGKELPPRTYGCNLCELETCYRRKKL